MSQMSEPVPGAECGVAPEVLPRPSGQVSPIDTKPAALPAYSSERD